MSEWISVKDRLPEVGSDFLVYDTYYKRRGDDPCVQRGRMTISWGIATIGENGENDTITHWMPLPYPPLENKP